MRTYPIEYRVSMLRPIPEDPQVYERREEIWLRLAEMQPDGNVPKKLVEARSTGQRFKLTRRVSPEAVEDGAEKINTGEFSSISPSDFMFEIFEQVAGEPVADWKDVLVGAPLAEVQPGQ
jgi:hypothetical protein